jgi:glycosyltransferase involved in cell wall biosynthesis
MTIELASRRAVHRLWGVNEPSEWAGMDTADAAAPIGEIWYDRVGAPASTSSLLLKVLLTSAPLSIQVHPNDEHAHSIGLPNGKSEAWHVLSATSDARVAIGLKQPMTAQQLRIAALDGSIADAVAWKLVAANDTIMVPGGTIHAIGAGLVIAEIQQRSNTTFRLFDHGRARELHIDQAVAASISGAAGSRPQPNRLSGQRTLLGVDRHFVLERLELPADTTWHLAAQRETWLLVVNGSASTGTFALAKGEALFAEEDNIKISAGRDGLVALVAYVGNGPVAGILHRAGTPPTEIDIVRPVTSAIGSSVSQIGMSPKRPIQRVAFVGNYLPRRCGIATFTHDLHQAVVLSRPALETCVVAMNDAGRTYDYPDSVEVEIADETIDSYLSAAATLNRGGFDVVSLQHEYGIFGGSEGCHIIELLKRLTMPVVTTLHTVLAEPSPDQRAVMDEIIARSARLLVMAEKGHELLKEVYGVPSRMIDVIPHGIPDVPFSGTHDAKCKLGLGGKTIILTFGLLSPTKGIETVIEAMPKIVDACPDAVYVVLGASHPNLVRQHGEAYRESLQARVAELDLDEHVVFIDQFVDQATLLDFIAACDVYVTPYLNEAQMTSGTLAYSFGLGKAVVSTPYWHASELLDDGRGILVPFGDTLSIGREIAGLLSDEPRRNAMRQRAYTDSRSMTWARTAATYLSTFEAVKRNSRPAPLAIPTGRSAQPVAFQDPQFRTSHFLSMCDSTGLLQHAIHCIPDRAHGYCVDDNARALLLSVALGGPGEPRFASTLTTRFAAFIQHAWNPDTRRFRNFMSYDRRWLEPQGSEDSHARTLWALGACAGADPDASRRRWAGALFEQAMPSVEWFTSPRAWAFALLGIDAYITCHANDPSCERMRGILAEKLLVALRAVETSDEWVWFEDQLAYDNARLPQALIATGVATKNQDLIDAGMRALRWLMTIQSSPNGNFRPVGTESFGNARRHPLAFDQQPVEAAATISACLAAWNVTHDPEWASGATSAFAWFLGQNDLSTPLADPETGSCRDGLHRDRVNENRGAESVLSYLLGVVEMRQFSRATSIEHQKKTLNSARSTQGCGYSSLDIPGGSVVPIPVLKPTNVASQAGPGSGRGAALQARD